MEQMTAAELEVSASNFRKKMKIDVFQCPDIESLVQAVSLEYGISFVPHFDEEMPNEPALADCENKTVHYRYSLRADLRRGDKRARFIFTEEIAHIVLGHRGIRNRSLVDRIYERVNAQVRIDEREARRFAAAVLAPLDRIDSDWDALKIAEFFQISLTAAEIRKEEADRARRLRTSVMRPLPQCAIDFLKEAKRRGYPVNSKID